jgi:hypothetical protein
MQPPSESTKLEGYTGFKEYKAASKLQGKNVLITGGEYALLTHWQCHDNDAFPYVHLLKLSSSGIGRAVAILMAREGADITIVYLPQEQPDAEDTKAAVEAEGKHCLLVAGDLMDNANCKRAVDEHVNKYVRLTRYMLYTGWNSCVPQRPWIADKMNK